ncbi:hypothetical protein OV450_7408 [Actinobacteria bacterium OV450]|nr:hypothetical protein OV450_7408 [Actinobacteria bacterium OV450]
MTDDFRWKSVEPSTSAFLGPVPGGPGRPVRVRNWAEFLAEFPRPKDEGGAAASSYLWDAVSGWFVNGGDSCFIVGTAESGDPVAAYRGDADEGTGLAALESVPEVKTVIVPDLWQAGEDAPAIAKAVAGHCADMGNRMAVLHTRPGLTPGEAVKVPELFGLDHAEAQFTTVYYPWVRAAGTDGNRRLVPPTGHVAGVWARVDAARGVHVAPGNQIVQGVTSVERELTDAEQALTNTAQVNVLGNSSGDGVHVWGVRTLSQDTNWTYIHVRRLINCLTESIKTGTTWATFDPNDDRVRSSIHTEVSSFLMGQWREGVLSGKTPQEAFYVICDKTNNPPESVAANKLVCDIGVAANRPAEFIPFRVTQTVGASD